MTMYQAYDRFAWVYNRHWSDYSASVLPLLRRLLLDQLAANARILDLCCGTGQLAAALMELGYTVVGLDGSSEMLRFARQNAPRAQFVQGDARAFSLQGPFDAVLSLYDSLNHIWDLFELTAAFRCAHAVLAPGGAFLVDLNMKPGYVERWRGTFAIVRDDYVVAARNSYDADRELANFEAALFFAEENGRRWERTDVVLTQRAYELNEVMEALEAAGFHDVSATSPDEETPLDAAGRLFFLAHKPS